MNIAVLGLGYVGTTTAACLVRSGHRIYGIDINSEKVAAFAAGRSPIVEPGVEDLLREGAQAGLLHGATSIESITDMLDMALVCVGTPLGPDGRLDYVHLLDVIRRLGRAVRRRDRSHPPLLIVVRSTVTPGTMDKLILPTLALEAGSGPGEQFEIAFNPEFMREASAVKDYFAPPRIVIGERVAGVTRRLLGIYDGIDAPLFEVPFHLAESAKLLDNCFHALKVAFANEIGRLAFGLGLLPARLAELFLADGKLNLSAAYLRPGAPYGGPCLPKDLRGLLATARACALELPVLRAVEASNRLHLAFLVERIAALVPPPGPLFLLGLAFKEGVEDVRGSPQLELLAQLAARDYAIEVFDPDLEPEDALAVERGLPAGARLHGRGAVEAALARARLVILAKRSPDVLRRLPPGLPIVDLLRLDLPDPRERSPRTTRGAA
ncbi:MAG: nucleotide sugar dehydrogenase [Geminicoccaceae bacterium]|nr:nucleotide sugar dehydrogenase [Geminicoccaceae bacterium]